MALHGSYQSSCQGRHQCPSSRHAITTWPMQTPAKAQACHTLPPNPETQTTAAKHPSPQPRSLGCPTMCVGMLRTLATLLQHRLLQLAGAFPGHNRQMPWIMICLRALPVRALSVSQPRQGRSLQLASLHKHWSSRDGQSPHSTFTHGWTPTLRGNASPHPLPIHCLLFVVKLQGMKGGPFQASKGKPELILCLLQSTGSPHKGFCNMVRCLRRSQEIKVCTPEP